MPISLPHLIYYFKHDDVIISNLQSLTALPLFWKYYFASKLKIQIIFQAMMMMIFFFQPRQGLQPTHNIHLNCTYL